MSNGSPLSLLWKNSSLNHESISFKARLCWWHSLTHKTEKWVHKRRKQTQKWQYTINAASDLSPSEAKLLWMINLPFAYTYPWTICKKKLYTVFLILRIKLKIIDIIYNELIEMLDHVQLWHSYILEYTFIPHDEGTV